MGLIYAKGSSTVLEETEEVVRRPLADLPDGCLVDLLQFCPAESLSAVQAVSRHLRGLVRDHEHFLWSPLTANLPFAKPGAGPAVSWLYNRWLSAERELVHLNQTQSLLNALSQMPEGKVIGLIANIGRFKDPRVALCVSRMRQCGLASVAVSGLEVATEFRTLTKYTRPVTFTTHLDSNSRVDAFRGIMEDLEAEDPAPPGFLGFAFRMIELRPEEECYRETILFGVYRHLSVWETRAQAEAFCALLLRRGGEGAARQLWWCALDDDGEASEGPAEAWCKTGSTTFEGVSLPVPLGVAFGSCWRTVPRDQTRVGTLRETALRRRDGALFSLAALQACDSR